ncbi:unnamed protein product, partial [Sphagnum compactum]
VVPMEEFNLHLTGDIHAIGASNNLLAAAIETRMFHESKQNDKTLFNTITWNRVLDVCDRFLRGIRTGIASTEKFERENWLRHHSCLRNHGCTRARLPLWPTCESGLGNMVVGMSRAGKPVTADDLGVGGALCVLMKDAIQPTMMQARANRLTVERTPVLVHAGPFANIAHGQLLHRGGPNRTQARGRGMEKFFDIKCRYSGLTPQVAVVVATVRALKMHGGGPEQSLLCLLNRRRGCANLLHHVRNVSKFGVKAVVAINRSNIFISSSALSHPVSLDSPQTLKNELNLVARLATSAGAFAAVVANHWAEGGKGAIGDSSCLCYCYSRLTIVPLCADLANAVAQPAQRRVQSPVLLDSCTRSRIVSRTYTNAGYGTLPVCMAKTQYSLSTDALRKPAVELSHSSRQKWLLCHTRRLVGELTRHLGRSHPAGGRWIHSKGELSDRTRRRAVVTESEGWYDRFVLCYECEIEDENARDDEKGSISEPHEDRETWTCLLQA